MLNKIENNQLFVTCNKCGRSHIYPIVRELAFFNARTQEIEIYEIGKWNQELGFYQDYPVPPCVDCGSIETLVLNIPTGEMDEVDLEVKEMSYQEINQRFYVRQLIRMVREDFQIEEIEVE